MAKGEAVRSQAREMDLKLWGRSILCRVKNERKALKISRKIKKNKEKRNKKKIKEKKDSIPRTTADRGLMFGAHFLI